MKHPVLTVAVSAVAAVAITIVALGGFGERPTQSIRVAPGEEIDQGMMVYTVSSATVTYDTTFDAWDVVVTGTVRNPNSESLEPIEAMYGNVIGVDQATEQYINDPSYDLGPLREDSYYRRSVLPPQSDWMDIRLTFTLKDPYEPSDTFPVLFRPMEYRTAYILGYSPDKEWVPKIGECNFVVYVPLTRLPDQ